MLLLLGSLLNIVSILSIIILAFSHMCFIVTYVVCAIFVFRLIVLPSVVSSADMAKWGLVMLYLPYNLDWLAVKRIHMVNKSYLSSFLASF